MGDFFASNRVTITRSGYHKNVILLELLILFLKSAGLNLFYITSFSIPNKFTEQKKTIVPISINIGFCKTTGSSSNTLPIAR